MYIDLDKVMKTLIISDYDLEGIIRSKVFKINSYFGKYSFEKAIIGLSGGIDSAVSAALAVRALGAQNILAYSLPYSDELHSNSSSVAKEVADSLGIEIVTVSIKPIVDAFSSCFPASGYLGKGNASARARMMVLMHAATIKNGLVIGTENKTEEMLAYYTIGGDDTTHIEPIHDLFKTQIFQLAKALKLPDSVLNRAPSAELWAGQTDEQELGASYEIIDNVLVLLEQKNFHLLDNSPTTKNIINRYNKIEGKRMCPVKL